MRLLIWFLSGPPEFLDYVFFSSIVRLDQPSTYEVKLWMFDLRYESPHKQRGWSRLSQQPSQTHHL